MSDFLKFVQFTKVQEQKDGKVLVWGVATWERPDLDNETCEYEAAKAAYEAWSNAAKERTSGAGQEVSVGNIRYQHTIEPAGKAVKIEYDDEAKEIRLGSIPISDEIHEQLKQGFLTGYSQGGAYAWRKCMDCGKNLTLQQANNFCPNCKKSVPVLFGLKRVSEVSYVDSPCTGKGFDYVKTDGTTQFVKFAKRGDRVELTQQQIEQIAAEVRKGEAKTKRVAGVDLKAESFAYVGDPEKTATWKLPIDFPGDDEKTKTHIRNALSRFSQTKGIPDDKKAEVKAKIVAAAKKHGIDVDDEGNTKNVREFLAAVEKRAGEAKLEKGLWAVGRLADVLQTLAWLYDDAVIEREIEGDDSDVPDELKSALEHLIEIFIASATEEAKELAAAKKADITKGGSTMTPEEQQKQLDEVQKAAKKSLASHFAKSAVHHEKLAKAHHDAAESHDTMCDAAKAAHEASKSVKADAGGETPHASVANGDYYKAAMAHHAQKSAFHGKMAKAHEAHAEHLSKMAESHDKEEAEKALKAERESVDAVQKNATPDDFTATAVKKAQSELLNDPKFMEEVKEAQRKALLTGIVDKTVADEVAKRRETTLAPDGVRLAGANGAATENLTVVPRDKEQFKLASTAPASTECGL